MTLQEAIASGRAIYRTGKPSFHPVDGTSYTVEEVMATDWEIDEPTVPLSAGRIFRAFVSQGMTPYQAKFEQVCASLGLECDYNLKGAGK